MSHEQSNDTQGRIEAKPDYASPFLQDQNGNRFAMLIGRTFNDARRIAACWNACEGIPTDELEPGEYEKHIIDTGNEIGRLEAERDELQREVNGKNAAIQRAHDRWFDAAAERDHALAINAELLAALEAAVARQAYKHGGGPEWWESARAAIAKAKGGAA